MIPFPNDKELAGLRKYVEAGWAKPTLEERNEKRFSSTMEEIDEFYNAMMEKMDYVMTNLQKFDVDTISPEWRTIMQLGLAFMDAAPAVEIYRVPDLKDAYFDFRRVNVREVRL